MSYYKSAIATLLFLQIIALCCAQYRYAPGVWPASAMSLSDMEDFDKANHPHLNNMNENEILEKFLPISYRPKKFFRKIAHVGEDERKKKFLTESLNPQDGDNLQGLWAMPGRRR